jgi:hypothetical protein
MQPVLSAEGLPVGWLNYKTGVSGIQLKMDAGQNNAAITILLTHNDPAVQQLHYDQFVQLRRLLYDTLGEDDWTWLPGIKEAPGKPISSISKTLTGVNIHNQSDWPAIISFLKPRLIAFDEFWSMTKYSFESLT